MVFTVPKALRGLFERDRRLLGILARSAHDATRGWMKQALELSRALPGMVSSIQTFGSYGNWHPHVHALLTDGLVEPGGRFHALGAFDEAAVEERFRRLVLDRLRRAERLSESFHERPIASAARSVCRSPSTSGCSPGSTRASRSMPEKRFPRRRPSPWSGWRAT